MSEIPQGASSEEQNTGRQLWTGELPHFHAGLALGQETKEKCVRLEVLREFGKADGKFLIPNCPSEAIWRESPGNRPALVSLPHSVTGWGHCRIMALNTVVEP